ncbi:MAG: hypothetical protein AB7C89_06600 [Intestinibacillus sp.]
MATKRKPNERDYITNKVLSVFTLCLVGVLLLMLLYRVAAYGSTYMLGRQLTGVVCGLGVLGLIWGAVKLAMERKAHEDMRYRLLRGRNIIVVFAVLTVCMAAILLFSPEVIKLFYIILPAIAVYYLIYHSYPREFFVISVDCGLMAVLLYLVRRALGSASHGSVAWLAAAVAVVLCAVQIAGVFYVKKHGCQGLVDGQRTELFTSGNAHAMMILTAVVLAVLPVAAVILGAQIAYYLIFAAFAYLFVTAVYYTVKMM